jgi:hypothetical protein
MKGGVVGEVIGWMRGWKFFGQWGEVVEFIIVAGVFGIILGFVGAVLASIIERLRHRLTPL